MFSISRLTCFKAAVRQLSSSVQFTLNCYTAMFHSKQQHLIVETKKNKEAHWCALQSLLIQSLEPIKKRRAARRWRSSMGRADTPRPTPRLIRIYVGNVRHTNRVGTLPKCGHVHMHTPYSAACEDIDAFFFKTESQSAADVRQTESPNALPHQTLISFSRLWAEDKWSTDPRCDRWGGEDDNTPCMGEFTQLRYHAQLQE